MNIKITLVGSRSSQLSHPEARMTKVASVRYASPARQLDQDNPNPSSMFTPRHYDYSDNSDLSFCVDNNMNLKGIQLLLSYDFNVSDVYLLFYNQTIRYRCTVDRFVTSASVPTYPIRWRARKKWPWMKFRRRARRPAFHVIIRCIYSPLFFTD